MPEESINIFISNLYAVAIFTGLFVVFFLILFLISRIFITRSIPQKSKKPSDTGSIKSFVLHTDTSLTKTLFIAGIIFVNIIFLILLMMLSLYFVTNFQVDKSLYMVFFIVFLILLTTVYVIRSKIIKR